MAISKRLRFEVLRRDNHTCRYCGRQAPEIKLTVDHVTPTTLGGSDAPENLVAACTDCNAGKSSVPAGAPLIADVAQDAIRWGLAMTKAAELMDKERTDRAEQHDRFDALWSHWRGNQLTWDQAKKRYVETPIDIPRDIGWRDTVDRLLAAGLTIPDLAEAITIAMGAKVPTANTWRYFCGVSWNKVKRLQEIAQQLLAIEETGI